MPMDVLHQIRYVVTTTIVIRRKFNSRVLTCTVDASIALTASGGTGVYNTYEVSYNGGGYAVVLSLPYTATVDGTYEV